ncbi:MAG: hypothetical protein VW397_08710 [Candidatus Margulisiibacteriota bacterium]
MEKYSFGGNSSIYNNSYASQNGVSLGLGAQTSRGGGSVNFNLDNKLKFSGTDLTGNHQFKNGSGFVGASFDSKGKFSGGIIGAEHRGLGASAGLDHKGNVNQLGVSKSDGSSTISTSINVRNGKPIGGGVSFTKRF